ncbi:MAG: fused MFS/spermidine synthase [Candidatus Rokubacteria bacterium]|nr:fused MFS/spermidine synthase [Candidatus Rokubacteria bacterium]
MNTSSTPVEARPAGAPWAERDPTSLADPVLFLCFFFSGASGLIYEVVWLRWLVNLFGATTLAVSTILTAFMGGLAVGSWLAGRWAPRIARPLRAYGLLELTIGAYALLLPLSLQAVPPALRVFGATDVSSYLGLSLARFALAAALLIVPTACMGATLPIVAQFAARRLESLGGCVGRLYAVNTAGAVLGTAAAGFLLLPSVGVTLTNQIAVALNVAVGLTAIVVGLRLTSPGGPPTLAGSAGEATSPKAPAGLAAPEPEARRRAIAALGAVALSGALAMVYEVAWTRALALVLGSSVYAFTVMLTTFLVGLAGGSYLAARRVDRVAEPGLALGVIQLLIGLAAFVGLAVLAELPYLFLRLFAWSAGRHALLLGLEFLIAGALILVPALLSGAVFPVCVRLTAGAREWPEADASGREQGLAGRRPEGSEVPEGGTAARPPAERVPAGMTILVGRTVGSLYALNTLGAIVGSFVGGFVLLPAVGIRGALLLAVLLNLGCAFALLVVLPTRRRGVRLPLAAGAPLLALAVPLAAPEWPALTMSSGVAIYAPGLQRLSRQEFQRYRERAHLLWYEEGLTTTVSVEEQGGFVFLRVNGKTDASSGVDMPNQVLAGQLPVLFHLDPRDVLVIGLGSGVSVGSALRHPLRSVTVVELERAVVTASHFFDHVNGRPLEDPRTRLVVNDARNYLLLTRDRFDVIISEPSNPWVTGAASLFTQDFFQLAKTRLQPGGIFGQWVQLYGLTPEMLRTVFATFGSAFPYAAVFHTTGGDTVLVGSEAPLSLDFAALQRRIRDPRVAEDLRRVSIRDAADLFARLILDTEDVPRFTRSTVLNTDDNARIEFAAPRTLYVDAIPENVQRMSDAFAGGGTVMTQLARSAPDGFMARLGTRLLERDQPHQADAVVRVALQAAPRADLLVVGARAAAARGEEAEAERRWQAALAVDPGHIEALLDLAEHLDARGQVEQARALLRRAAVRRDPEALLREAELLYRLGAYPDAEGRLRRLSPDFPGAALTAGLIRLALGDATAAEHLLRKALEPRDDARARAGLAAALDQLGRYAEARRERRRAIQLDEAAGTRLMRQARVRAQAGHLRWAEHELRHAGNLMPWSLEVHQERARLLEQMGDRPGAIDAWEEVFRAFPQHALALLEVATLWDAEGDKERALEALRRYIAAEPDRPLRRRAEVGLKMLLERPRESRGPGTPAVTPN